MNPIVIKYLWPYDDRDKDEAELVIPDLRFGHYLVFSLQKEPVTPQSARLSGSFLASENHSEDQLAIPLNDERSRATLSRNFQLVRRIHGQLCMFRRKIQHQKRSNRVVLIADAGTQREIRTGETVVLAS